LPTRAGVYGSSNSTSGYGIAGVTAAGTGSGIGVYADCASADGIAIKANSGYGKGLLVTSGGGHASPQIQIEAIGTDTICRLRYKSGATFWDIAEDSSGDQLRFWSGTAAQNILTLTRDSNVGIETISPARLLHAHGRQGVGKFDRDVNSASFIFVRTAQGNFSTVWKAFDFGVDASGVGNGRFFIGDLGTAVCGVHPKRLVIDKTGKVGIGTEPPSEMVHVDGNVKASQFIIGDIKFANDYIVTEDEKEGLASRMMLEKRSRFWIVKVTFKSKVR
jgi:hypothetical protein